MTGYLVDEIEKTRLSRQNGSVRVLYAYCVFDRLSRRNRTLNKKALCVNIISKGALFPNLLEDAHRIDGHL